MPIFAKLFWISLIWSIFPGITLLIIYDVNKNEDGDDVKKEGLSSKIQIFCRKVWIVSSLCTLVFASLWILTNN